MKKYSTKIIALCLCALLAVSGVAATAFARNSDGNETENQENPESVSVADNAGISKDETVYVLAGADGSVQKIIVSDWLRNSPGNAAVSDKSELTDVENVRGDETYTMNDDNMRVWDAQGNDIYYQGNIEKELPVDLSVSYKLDGKPITADDLVGKSGRVTIRFDYQDRQYESVEIDGKQEKIYVPFAMLTGALLSDDVFTNVEVTNGKLIDDGNRTAVIGIAFPGLQENLAISGDKLEIPDYVEISADANHFRLDMTVTLAANELFSELDADGLDSVSELSASVDELTSAMDQLTAGAESLKNGAGSLDAGAAELQSGAAQLSEGLDTLASNNDTLNDGAKQVFDTLLSTANTQLAAAGLDVPELTVENYAQVLNGVIAEQTEQQIRKAVSEQMASDEVQAQPAAAAEGAESVIALKSSLDSYNIFYLGLQSYTAGVADAATGAETLKAGTDDLKDGASQLSAGASELCDGVNEFYEEGIQKLVDAVDGDLNGLAARFRATRDVSLRYKNFAGLGEDMDGQVKFIYRTDAIE